MLIPLSPSQFRKRPARSKAKASAAPPPINTIAKVSVHLDLVTIDILFTPGTVVTGLTDVGNNFFVNYSGGQTAPASGTIVNPTLVRVVLLDAIDDPSTWEVDSVDLFSFATGTFGGPQSGDVVFT